MPTESVKSSEYDYAQLQDLEDDEEEEELNLIAPRYLRQAFDAYAEGGRYMKNEHVGAALRSLGLSIVDDELDPLINEVIAEGLGGGSLSANISANPNLSSVYFKSIDQKKFGAIAFRVQQAEREAVGNAAANGNTAIFQPTEREVEEYRRAFLTFDRENTGYVKVEHLGLILHQIGLHTSKSELRALEIEMDRDATGEINFAHFLVMVARLRQDECAMDELLEAFQTYDPHDTGVIDAAILADNMAMLCEAMSVSDIKDLVYGRPDLIDGRGKLDYRRLISVMVKAVMP